VLPLDACPVFADGSYACAVDSLSGLLNPDGFEPPACPRVESPDENSLRSMSLLLTKVAKEQVQAVCR